MRILQVVTLLSPTGAYGGPARVALNQSAELIKQGNDVIVAAASRGYRVPPTQLNGVPLRLFSARTLLPGTGFAGLGAPALTRWFRSRHADFDIVHVHFARDLVTVPVAESARRHGLPYVLQTHGMVVPSGHPLAAPLDVVRTRRILRDAGAVFFLTADERTQLEAVAHAPLRLVELTNGVPDHPPTVRPTGRPEVLFVARMHSRKRPIAFVEMASTLLDSGVDARFTLIGPDEGEGPALRTAICGDSRIAWEGSLAPVDVAVRMAAASVYVLPAVREPYPMSVLEAMAVGLPVVITADCGLAPLVQRTHSGIVTDPDVSALAAATRSILADRSLAQAMGQRGREAVRSELGMRAVGERLVDVYTELVGGAP